MDVSRAAVVLVHPFTLHETSTRQVYHIVLATETTKRPFFLRIIFEQVVIKMKYQVIKQVFLKIAESKS